MLTSARLRELLAYDPITGQFTFRQCRGPMPAGSVAGTDARGRIAIHVDYRLYRAHRLAWLYVTGAWPAMEIDHIDGNPSNNAWSNLRDVSPRVNQQNRRRAPRNKKYSRLLGAHWCAQHQLWKSSIRVDGRAFHLGVFESEEAAHAAYVEAKRRFHPGCTL